MGQTTICQQKIIVLVFASTGLYLGQGDSWHFPCESTFCRGMFSERLLHPRVFQPLSVTSCLPEHPVEALAASPHCEPDRRTAKFN